MRCSAKLEPEAAAFASFAFKSDAAAHAFEAPADQGQAYAGAGIVFLRMKALEQAEDLFVILGSDADALIGHPNADRRRRGVTRDL